jgi:hypothetical protein
LFGCCCLALFWRLLSFSILAVAVALLLLLPIASICSLLQFGSFVAFDFAVAFIAVLGCYVAVCV